MNNKLVLFKALSDETRLKIIEFLLGGEKCVCEIVPHTKRKQSTISIQLSKMESWGILKTRREGKNIHYRIANDKIIKLLSVI